VFSHCHPGDSLRLMGAHMSSHVVATAVAVKLLVPHRTHW
jgi:hypothetical protein